MKFFITLLKYILSFLIWTNFWIVFTITSGLTLFLSLFISGRKLDKLVRVVCTVTTYALFLSPDIHYISGKIKNFPVIYVANHVSFFDIFLSGTVLEGYPRGFELKSHFKTPIYGWFITRFGQVPMDSRNKNGVRESFKAAAAILNKKERSFFIMPEGTRTRTGKLGHFKLGAFYLSRKTGCPIIPVIFKNLYLKNNAVNYLIRPGKVDIVIGEPILPGQFNTDQEMSEYTWNIMNNILHESQ